MRDITRREAMRVMLAGACVLPLTASLSSCSKKDEGTHLSSSGDAPMQVDDASASFGYGVSTSCAPATDIGMKILEQGGNAVDAAIAISYALGVCQPYGSGVGGGGCMIIYDTTTEKATFVDYYDAAPTSFSSMAGAVCVPGFVKGMETLHSQFATMEARDLIQPAVDMARNGFTVSERLATMAESYQDSLGGLSCYWKDEGLIEAGDTLVQPELADTLARIAQDGAQAFYGGEIGQGLCAATGMAPSDFSAYEVKVRQATSSTAFGCKVISSPSPYGGSTLIEMLKMLEHADAPAASEDTAGYLAALLDASDRSYALRTEYVGDPDFVSVDEQYLVSDGLIDASAPTPTAGFADAEGESTTSFAVIDSQGLIVSATNTLGDFYGCGQTFGGFHLNSHMTSFSATGPNKFEPGKRPRSHTASSVVVGDSFAFGIGTPGGKRIPKILSSVMFDILHSGEEVQRAVDKNRVLFENGSLYMEKLDGHDDLIDVSQTSGYSVIRKGKGDFFGAVQIIGCKSDGSVFGATDARREGSLSVRAAGE